MGWRIMTHIVPRSFYRTLMKASALGRRWRKRICLLLEASVPCSGSGLQKQRDGFRYSLGLVLMQHVTSIRNHKTL